MYIWAVPIFWILNPLILKPVKLKVVSDVKEPLCSILPSANIKASATVDPNTIWISLIVYRVSIEIVKILPCPSLLL